MAKKQFRIPETGAERIRQRLKELEFGQEKFSEEKLCCSSRTLRNWLGGKTKIDEHNLEKLLMHVSLGIGDIFGDDLPRLYKDKSTLSRLVDTFRKLVLDGDVRQAIKKYRAYLKDLSKHVTFHRIPLTGIYFMFEHDETHCHHYAVVSLKTDPQMGQSTYVLSWRFLSLVRVNLGEITVTQGSVTVKPFFQKYPHTVKRASSTAPALFGFWLARDGSYFFLEGKEGAQVDAHIDLFLTEREHDERQDEVAVFWRGVYL